MTFVNVREPDATNGKVFDFEGSQALYRKSNSVGLTGVIFDFDTSYVIATRI